MTACAEMALLVQAELDGELDAAGAAALARHVAGCAGCAALRGELAGLSARLSALPRGVAPAGLRRAVVASLPRRRGWGARGRWFGGGLLGGAAMAAAVAFAVMPRAGVPGVVAAHIRALQPGHLVDVESSDQHTVKPWFDGRLDYAPPVRDFSAAGFPLVGGRLDYVEGRPVAVLVYRRDRHLIDVFVWPGSGGTVAGAQGYGVEAWSAGGMAFRAVSDLNAVELAALGRLLRSP